MTGRFLLAAVLGLAVSGAAQAQSYTAPAGIPAATAPGGLEGQAANRNFNAYAGRSSQVVTGQPGIDAYTGSVRAPSSQRGR